MTTTLKTAEQAVCDLINGTNRTHPAAQTSPWDYELTSDVDNISVHVREGGQTLQVHPGWLRYVLERDDFLACVADEITAWYLIKELTSSL